MVTRKKRRGFALTALNWGVLGVAIQRAVHNQNKVTERATMEELRAQNLELKNVNLTLDQGYHSNRVVKGDIEIEKLKTQVELLKEKLARERFVNQAMGVDAPPMEVLDYPDLGEK